MGGSGGDGGGLPECGVVLGGAVVLVVRVQHVLRRCVPLSSRARSGIQVRSICWVWEWRSFAGGVAMDDTGCSFPGGWLCWLIIGVGAGRCKRKRKVYMLLAAMGFFPGPAHRKLHGSPVKSSEV